ncbi:MAG: HAD family hydrolase [Neisseria sp.]|nr:HAD family hydrolase [Neisseria sp.]
MNNLAIFDLDHTLILCDSDVQWSAYLAEKGILGADDAEKREAFYQDYENGCLNMDEFLRFQLAPLTRFSRNKLDAMHREFTEQRIMPHVTAEARALVARHLEAGDDVLLISATNEFIITPIAHLFGIENIIGVRLEVDANKRYTGNHLGTPSFKEGKVKRLSEWLAARGKTLSDYAQSYFYSDSHNDLPLLEVVSVPIAVNPDPKLAAHAAKRGWRTIRLTEAAC